MARPTAFTRQTSFTQFSSNFPSKQQNGASLDAEFNAAKVALDETQSNLALIQDDDGELARGSVGRAQLDSSITIGFDSPTPWAADTSYTADTSTVWYTGKFYTALETHTSTALFDSTKWFEVADLSASAAIEDGSITDAKLSSSAVTADKIQALAVTTPKLATDAVTTVKIIDAAVTAAKLASDAVTTLKILDEAVTNAKLATDAVTNNKMAADAVNTAEIVDLAVTTAKIANGAVTLAKMTLTGLFASKAQMEAETAATVAVTPDLVRNSPGVAKAWGKVTVAAGVATLVTGFNVTNVVRSSAGVFQINFATVFSSANYALIANLLDEAATVNTDIKVGTCTANAAIVNTYADTTSGNTARIATDRSFHFVVFGDQ